VWSNNPPEVRSGALFKVVRNIVNMMCMLLARMDNTYFFILIMCEADVLLKMIIIINIEIHERQLITTVSFSFILLRIKSLVDSMSRFYS